MLASRQVGLWTHEQPYRTAEEMEQLKLTQRLALQLLAARSAAELPKMSSKKKKRLDNYINAKLKKEERKELIASLACVSSF